MARSRTFREHQNKILLEGRRLICDALDAGALPQTVFFSTIDRLKELPLDKLRRASLVKVKFEDIKIWSDVVAPQGVIGEGPFLIDEYFDCFFFLLWFGFPASIQF